ncbi:MAG: hypothetical protein OXG15_14540 [Gammaproteobacteria bacterium]|nr:hypothetical protein [Gammaproteobacteria bacterium]
MLRRLTLLAWAIAIAGCAETKSNESADSTERPNLNTPAQVTVDESSDAVGPASSAQETTQPAAKPVGEDQNLNTNAIDRSASFTSPQPSRRESEDTNTQRSSTSDHSDQQSTFNQHMTAVHRAIEQKRWKEASRLLEEALQLQPNSNAAQDLRDFVASQQQLLDQQDLAERFTAAIQVEHWTEASKISKGIKTQDSATLEQIERSEILVTAEQLADRLLSDPKRLSRPSVQSEVSRLRSLTEDVDPGNRVGEKLSKLRKLSHRWTTPVVVNLNSDGNTTVILRPGRSLGQFRSQKIRLMPGEYVLIGRRDGFREVRRSLQLDPNGQPMNIEIKALERF